MKTLSEKQQVRKTLLASRKMLWHQPHQVALLESKILHNLHGLLLTLKSRGFQNIASYVPFGSELDVNGAFEGVRWFPKTTNESDMLWFSVDKKALDLLKLKTTEKNKIPEAPAEQCQEFPASLPGNWVVIVPALGVDESKIRLGYGKGYYDRFLSKQPSNSIVTICCIPKQFILSQLPKEPHDATIDFVVTEDSYY